jgi:hypothetical protein
LQHLQARVCMRSLIYVLSIKQQFVLTMLTSKCLLDLWYEAKFLWVISESPEFIFLDYKSAPGWQHLRLDFNSYAIHWFCCWANSLCRSVVEEQFNTYPLLDTFEWYSHELLYNAWLRYKEDSKLSCVVYYLLLWFIIKVFC